MRSSRGGVCALALAGVLAPLWGACGTASPPDGFAPDGGSGASSGGDDGATAAPGDDGGSQTSFSVDAAIPTGTALGDAGCATAKVVARRQPAYLLFVQDGSDSMSQQNKWAAVVPALTSIFAKMQAAADPAIAAGLILFPDTGGPFPSTKDVPVAFVSPAQASALGARLGAGLALGTPTEAALTGGYGELEAFQPQAPLDPGGKKILILITDGVPTDGCANLLGLGSYTSNPCVQLAAQKLTEAGPQGPIETFVIGVGNFPSATTTVFDPAFVGNLAQAGGTAPAGCTPNENANAGALCYFEIDPSKAQSAAQLQAQFETALDTIRGQVVSCSFPIQTNGLGTADPTKVNVEVGGTTILQDPKNGWTYDDPAKPTEIVLHGSACAAATGSLTAKVSIVLGCATQSVQ